MFPYTTKNRQNLIKALSHARLSTYLNARNNDLEKALELYVKNIKISAAFLLPLQGLEISLRNSLNDTINTHYGTDDWFDKIPLDDKGKKYITKAKKTVKKRQQNPKISHIIAELPFGFWVAILENKYHQTL